MVNALPGRMVVLLLLAFAPGCVILPVPTVRLEAWGVSSCVVDADTGRPIRGAVVAEAYEPFRRVTTGPDGTFRLEPHRQLHLAYLYSAISYPLAPFTGDAVMLDRKLAVQADGYDTFTVTLSAFTPWHEKPGYIGDLPLETDVLQIPVLPLKRAAATRPAPQAAVAPAATP